MILRSCSLKSNRICVSLICSYSSFLVSIQPHSLTASTPSRLRSICAGRNMIGQIACFTYGCTSQLRLTKADSLDHTLQITHVQTRRASVARNKSYIVGIRGRSRNTGDIGRRVHANTGGSTFFVFSLRTDQKEENNQSTRINTTTFSQHPCDTNT